MQKLSGVLAILLLSTGANAAQQFSYDGHFISVPGFDFTENDRFSGQFTFNPDTPDNVSVNPPHANLQFNKNVSSSWVINDGQPTIGTNGISLDFVDNFNVESNSVGTVTPGVYDKMTIISSQFTSPTPNSGLFFDGTLINFNAYFAADSYTIADIQNLGYQKIAAMKPLFLEFFTMKAPGGIYEYQGLGVVNHYNVATVPLPGAAWLFGAAFAGLALRLRKRA